MKNTAKIFSVTAIIFMLFFPALGFVHGQTQTAQQQDYTLLAPLPGISNCSDGSTPQPVVLNSDGTLDYVHSVSPVSNCDYEFPMAWGPLVSQDCWIGIEWPPAGVSPDQYWPTIIYDVGAGQIILELTNGTLTQAYACPLSSLFDQPPMQNVDQFLLFREVNVAGMVRIGGSHGEFDASFNVAAYVADYLEARGRTREVVLSGPLARDQTRISRFPINAIDQHIKVRQVLFKTALVSFRMSIILLQVERDVLFLAFDHVLLAEHDFHEPWTRGCGRRGPQIRNGHFHGFKTVKYFLRAHRYITVPGKAKDQRACSHLTYNFVAQRGGFPLALLARFEVHGHAYFPPRILRISSSVSFTLAVMPG